ncbi:hypothetical protein RvY_14232 [Ramazzottius varieornatus]|uniref:Uncharacterized protein n=1 Tax=Ramazzottius varieornatus TaxID=947166 RepID=A0A1D1VUH3_RAMVA|nr:hypothetical protein RvY_14232 [Ramazzottius varieornatus]
MIWARMRNISWMVYSRLPSVKAVMCTASRGESTAEIYAAAISIFLFLVPSYDPTELFVLITNAHLLCFLCAGFVTGSWIAFTRTKRQMLQNHCLHCVKIECRSNSI